MIEQALDDVRRNSKPREIGGKRPTQIMERPRCNSNFKKSL